MSEYFKRVLELQKDPTPEPKRITTGLRVQGLGWRVFCGLGLKSRVERFRLVCPYKEAFKL